MVAFLDDRSSADETNVQRETDRYIAWQGPGIARIDEAALRDAAAGSCCNAVMMTLGIDYATRPTMAVQRRTGPSLVGIDVFVQVRVDCHKYGRLNILGAHPIPSNGGLTILWDPQRNLLLETLPKEESERIYPDLQFVQLPLGSVLYESGDVLQHVYFPTNSIVSLLYVMADGASAEIAVVGNEGLVGVALFMGGDTTPNRAVVQSAGQAYRLSAQRLKEEFRRNGGLQILLLRYTQALLTQMAQTAVCNRHHSVDQQLCRWLLLSLDRLDSNTLDMTQELIADMLGVRREGVTEAAGKLQRRGVIRYVRGRITVLDRQKLEHLSCECYKVVKKETDRLMRMKTVVDNRPRNAR